MLKIIRHFGVTSGGHFGGSLRGQSAMVRSWEFMNSGFSGQISPRINEKPLTAGPSEPKTVGSHANNRTFVFKSLAGRESLLRTIADCPRSAPPRDFFSTLVS